MTESRVDDAQDFLLEILLKKSADSCERWDNQAWSIMAKQKSIYMAHDFLVA